jgi:oligopeptide transport system permease protein
LRTSATLGALALGSALGAGIMLGVAAAAHRGSAIDHASVLVATAGAAVPGFVVAVFLMYLFGVKLDLLPVLGWGSPQQAVLPVITLSLAPAATLTRLTRASMIEALTDDYVRTATAKGLRRSAVLYRHALRNAAFPLLSALGPITAGLITGSFIVEHVFSIPGLGRAFVTSVNARDYGMIMGTTLFAAAVIAAVNLAVDISYGVLDPRVRHRAYAQ